MKLFFFSDFRELVYSIIDSAEKQTEKTLDPDYKNFLCSFYTEALAGILIDWIKNRKDRNRQQTIDYIVNTLRVSLLGILNHTK